MMTSFRKKFTTLARGRFGRDERGIAAVEFAIIAPLMVTLFIGTVELSQALTADRRVTQAVSSTADLIARVRSIDATQLDGVMDAIDEIIKPFDETRFRLTVANVVANIDDATQTLVCWSYQHNGGADPSIQRGAAYALPAGIVEAGDSVIVTEAAFLYVPLIFGRYIDKNGVTLTETFFLKPRLSLFIEFEGNDCGSITPT